MSVMRRLNATISGRLPGRLASFTVAMLVEAQPLSRTMYEYKYDTSHPGFFPESGRDTFPFARSEVQPARDHRRRMAAQGDEADALQRRSVNRR